jgi:hypothetical protein
MVIEITVLSVEIEAVGESVVSAKTRRGARREELASGPLDASGKGTDARLDGELVILGSGRMST